MSNASASPSKFDIAICGAGPVGLALALLLHKHGVTAEHITLIDAKTLEQSSNDPRSIALSYGSRQILEQVAAWPMIANTATAIEQIHVSRQGYFGRTLIDCQEHKVPALGYVTRYGALIASLSAAAMAAGITILRPTKLIASDEQEHQVTLTLADGQTLRADIMVQAEGGVFSEQAKRSLQRDYHQTAIIAHVQTSKPLPQRAFERFTSEGPLALLPQDKGYALVWCVTPDTATRLLALSDTEFLQALQQAFGTRLGRFTHTTQRHTYALGLNANPAISTRTIAIGNAAQTLHPVAGQGLNLGLRDAVVLAHLLAQHPTPATLQQYHAERTADRSLTCRLTDTMARVFIDGDEGERLCNPKQALLGMSLGMMDMFQPVRHLLAELMMFGRR